MADVVSEAASSATTGGLGDVLQVGDVVYIYRPPTLFRPCPTNPGWSSICRALVKHGRVFSLSLMCYLCFGEYGMGMT